MIWILEFHKDFHDFFVGKKNKVKKKTGRLAFQKSKHSNSKPKEMFMVRGTKKSESKL